MKFYRTMALPVVLYDRETWMMMINDGASNQMCKLRITRSVTVIEIVDGMKNPIITENQGGSC